MMRCLTFLAAVTILGCDNQADVTLTISAKTNQGNPIHQAEIVINHEVIGHTNETGTFVAQKRYAKDETISLEIRKQSEHFFFAPYNDSFKTGSLASSKLDIDAVLYFVPKPTAGEFRAAQQANPEADKNIVQPLAKDGPTDLPKDATESNALADAGPIQEPEIPPAEAKAESPPLPTPQPVDFLDSPHPGTMTEVGEETDQSRDFVVSVYAFHDKKPLSGVTIQVGQEAQGRLEFACETNQRGRCSMSFPERPQRQSNFVASKSGFETKSHAIQISPKGRVIFHMTKGRSIDILTQSKNYQQVEGLRNIKVFVQGQLLGETDRFGHFSHFFKGKDDELVEIRLESPDHLPAKFTTDFVAAGDMTLKKHYSPISAPKVKLGILPITLSGALDHPAVNEQLTAAEKHLQPLLHQTLFGGGPFQPVASSVIEKAANKDAIPIKTLAKSGWRQLDLGRDLDALLLPMLLAGENPQLQLAMVDSGGKTVAAATSEIFALSDKSVLEPLIQTLKAELIESFPLEGAITAVARDTATINIGKNSGVGLKKGRHIDIFGIQTDSKGTTKEFKKVGQGTVTAVSENDASIKIDKVLPRSTIDVGDLIVLNKSSAKSGKLYTLTINANDGKQKVPLGQAIVYQGDKWVGTSDDGGTVAIGEEWLKAGDPIKVIKLGFKPFQGNLPQAANGQYAITLEKNRAFLTVESNPAGALVTIEGSPIGKTPLSKPIEVPGGFVRITLKAAPGFKDYSSVLELDEGTLDLTGPRKIVLERDLLKGVRHMIDRGELQLALAKIKDIPITHSDYLLAQYTAGEIHLNMLNEPHVAALYFSRITKNPQVEVFQDKRFIGAHVNEAIAVFRTAEALGKDNAKIAIAHYEKAIDILDKVSPHLRFIKDDQQVEAQHNVAYHQSLALHRIYELSHNPDLLGRVRGAWQKYLESFAEKPQGPNTLTSYYSNAQVYFKQLDVQKKPLKENL